MILTLENQEFTDVEAASTKPWFSMYCMVGIEYQGDGEEKLKHVLTIHISGIGWSLGSLGDGFPSDKSVRSLSNRTRYRSVYIIYVCVCVCVPIYNEPGVDRMRQRKKKKTLE